MQNQSSRRPDAKAIARLIELGRGQGGLTAAEVQLEVPIGAMSPDEIAVVLAQLEDAGIDVEVDETLFASPPGQRSRLAPVVSTPVPNQPRVGAPAPLPGAILPASAAPAPEVHSGPGSPSAHVAVIIAGIVVLCVLFLLFVV